MKKEPIKHSQINYPFKRFFLRDTDYLFGMYFVVLESKESDGFIIGDCYPVVISGTTDWELTLHLYSIYPISANRSVLLVSNGADGAPRDVSRFRECILKQPKYDLNTNTIEIRVKSLHPEEVKYINTKIAENADEGFVYKKRPLYLIQ